MRLALRFWTGVAIWTGILLAIFTVLGLPGGEGLAGLIAHLPAWGGLALVLSAFPAGIRVAREVVPEGGLAARSIEEVTLAAAVVSLLVLVLAGYVGPAAVRALGPRAETVSEPDPTEMSITELRAEIETAIARAEADAVEPSTVAWLSANTLVWHYHRRWAGVLQPLLFGWLGVLTAFWARWSPRRDIAQAQYWAMGLFLVVSTYLAGENSFELIVLQAAGPVFFAGLFVLIVPSLLLVGLGWPTAVTLWLRHKKSTGT